MKQYVRRPRAAEYVKGRYGFCTEKSLAKAAVTGLGPKYHKIGKMVVYDLEDLDAWAQSRMSGPVSSTSEYPTAA